MPDLTGVTKYFATPSETYSDTLSSSISAGAATVPVNNPAVYDDDDVVVLTVEPGTANQATFTGTKSGSQFINCIWTEGNVGIGHTLGATIQDYDSATHFAMATTGILKGHNEEGTHKTFTESSIVPSNALQTGAVTPEKLQSGAGTSWAWQSWTPTLTNVTIGNGSVAASYCQIGKNIFFRLKIIWGSTSSITGNITVSSPVAMKPELYDASTEGYPIGQAKFLNAGLAAYPGYVQAQPGSRMIFLAFRTDTPYAAQATATGSVPFGVGSNDMIVATGQYEAA